MNRRRCEMPLDMEYYWPYCPGCRPAHERILNQRREEERQLLDQYNLDNAQIRLKHEQRIQAWIDGRDQDTEEQAS